MQGELLHIHHLVHLCLDSIEAGLFDATYAINVFNNEERWVLQRTTEEAASCRNIENQMPPIAADHCKCATL